MVTGEYREKGERHRLGNWVKKNPRAKVESELQFSNECEQAGINFQSCSSFLSARM